MAKSESFWGLDIGQSALKALRCRAGEDGEHITAEAFDFIEYPKILSQPDADPVELVRDAIQEFMSRNPMKGMKVAISVPGQRGLPRFVKLPPVESSKIPDLVKFEAKQQIPFPLEDVVWDFQQMPGGTEEDGFSMETEVGLFAMKRDEVFRSLRPFINAGIEVDIVQLTPISLFDYIVFDQMQDLPPPEEYNPDDPPESVVVLSLGTDTSDLVVTNGYRVWQRSIPLGGNHFTKAITKELKVTFSKAEHLKRNAMKTEDPRAIFQAMKPIFNDLVTEIQRSLNFFNSINKTAKLGRIVALGNTMKLRGLQKYLQQNLGMPVEVVESFRGLKGSGVVNSPQFEENVGSFGVSYGLCIQALDRGVLSTNLLPGEILRERLIRSKKPWAMMTAATLLLGCGLGYAFNSMAWKTTKTEPFKNAFAQTSALDSKSNAFVTSFKDAETKFDNYDKMGKEIAAIPERQILWPTLMRAINEALPQAGKTTNELINDEKGPIPLGKREQLHITSVDCEFFPKLETWFTPKLQEEWKSEHPQAKAAAPAAAEGEPPADGAAPPVIGPTGPGWVIQLTGHHFHNDLSLDSNNSSVKYIKRTLLSKLENKPVKVDGKDKPIPPKELIIEYPVLFYASQIHDGVEVLNPYSVDANPNKAGAGFQPKIGVAPPKGAVVEKLIGRRTDFVVQFVWKPQTDAERAELRKKNAEAEAAKKAATEAQ